MRKYKVIILITLTVLVSCRQMPKQESSGDNIDVSHFLNLEQEIRRLSEFVPDIEYFRPQANAGSYFQLMG